MKVTAIILAGGKNLRLGRNKALETVGGKSLIECAVESLEPLANQILIVTSREPPDLSVIKQSERLVVDFYPNKGPLGGIYTGLSASQFSHSIVVACDMPFLNAKLLQHMVELCDDFDAVVPRLGEKMVEPLHAVYSRNCLDNMKAQLERNQLSINYFLNTVRVRYIERAECQRFDPQLLSFFNINYPSDLAKAIALAKKNRC